MNNTELWCLGTTRSYEMIYLCHKLQFSHEILVELSEARQHIFHVWTNGETPFYLLKSRILNMWFIWIHANAFKCTWMNNCRNYGILQYLQVELFVQHLFDIYTLQIGDERKSRSQKLSEALWCPPTDWDWHFIYLFIFAKLIKAKINA